MFPLLKVLHIISDLIKRNCQICDSKEFFRTPDMVLPTMERMADFRKDFWGTSDKNQRQYIVSADFPFPLFLHMRESGVDYFCHYQRKISDKR